MIKTILRNNIVLFYMFMAVLVYLILLFMSIRLDPMKISFSESFHLYLLLSLGTNVISVGYFIFGFTFDYHRLLNFSSFKLLKKHIINSTITMIISSFIGFTILLFFIYVFNNQMIDNYVYLSFLNTLFNIPFCIILSIFVTKRLSLFDNKFIMSAQMPKSYIMFFLQVIVGAVFYFILSKINYSYIIILLIVKYLIFFINLKKIAQYLNHKVKNEYIRNK